MAKIELQGMQELIDKVNKLADKRNETIDEELQRGLEELDK